MTVLVAVCLAFAAIPALVYLRNLRVYRRVAHDNSEQAAISVLIPARNEGESIGPAVRAALASTHVDLEVIVLDDHSDDDTRAVVAKIAAEDPRVRVESAPALPPDWCGKQHACWILAGFARHDRLVFVDADVRLEPEGLARLTAFQRQSGADLVSGIPRQTTGTLFERLLIPLIHFLLLGFLPMWRMRRSTMPGYGAGCGQLFLATRAGYDIADGHAAIRASLHDGVTLPRAFRRAGRMSDLCDATDLATCRMYRGAKQVWFGLAKNAHEGIASPKMIVPCTVLLFGGQVLPFALLACAAWLETTPIVLAACAAMLAWLPRIDAAVRFRQSAIGAILHPFGVTLFLAIQWYAAVRRSIGKPSAWKGRAYPAAG